MATLKATYAVEQWINDNAIPTGEYIEFDISDAVRKMTGVERENLMFQLSDYSADLDYILDKASFHPDHNGPFTVTIDEDDLSNFMKEENLLRARYVIADNEESSWTHLVNDNRNETNIKFVYDNLEGKLIYAEIPGGVTNKGTYFVPASDEVHANIEDHLKNANEDALSSPLSWDLIVSDDLPDWVPEPETGPKP